MGELATAMAQGLRSQNVAATAKHWAVYSVPTGGRDGHARTDPHVARRELEALHLLPWRKLIKEGAIQVRVPSIYLGLYLGPCRAPPLPLSNRHRGHPGAHNTTHAARRVLCGSRPLPTPFCSRLRRSPRASSHTTSVHSCNAPPPAPLKLTLIA